MRLETGQSAIHFEVTDIFDKPVRLDDYKGKKLMVSFYRYASCPFCNLRILQLIKKHESFRENGLELVAFFQSPKKSILEYVGKQEPPFPIIPDPKRVVYKQYGIESSWWGMFRAVFLKMHHMIKAMGSGFMPGRMEGVKSSLPADFLIAPDLTIHRAYYGKDIGDHIPIPEIEEWLGSLQ